MLKKYPRLILLSSTYIAAFFIFSHYQNFIENFVLNFSLGSVFIAGAMYTYAFTTSIGVGLFLILAKSYSGVFLAIVGSVFSGLADVSIFKLFHKVGLYNELDSVSEEKWFISLCSKLPFLTSKIFLSVAGVLTMISPLPDELAIILIERGKLISTKYLFIIGVVNNTIGILILTSLVN